MQTSAEHHDEIAKLAPGGESSLAHLSDCELLASTRRLVGTSNRVFAALLVHLAEVEARGIHRTRACSSLYTYCIYELRFSEDAAARRAGAAKLVKRFPPLIEAIAAGELHLTGLLMLGPHFTDRNLFEVLGRAKFRTKKELAKLVRQLDPLPLVPDLIEPLRSEPVPPRNPTWQELVSSLAPPVRELPPGERPRDWANETSAVAGATDRIGGLERWPAPAPFPARGPLAGPLPALARAGQTTAKETATERTPGTQAATEQLADDDGTTRQSATGQAPIDQSATGQAPIDQSATGQAPIDQSATGQAPIDQSATGQAPIGQSAIGQAPIGRAGLTLPPVTGPQQYQMRFSTSEEHVLLVERAKALLARETPGQSLGELHLRAMRLLVAALEKHQLVPTPPRKAAKSRVKQQPEELDLVQKERRRDDGQSSAPARVPAAHCGAEHAAVEPPRQRGAEHAAVEPPRQRGTEHAAVEPPRQRGTEHATVEPPRQRGRHVPAVMRRAVFERDCARCTYVDERGERCRETHYLELHHRQPFAKDGPHTIENLTLHCAAHNALAAELDFGSEHMARWRDALAHESRSSQAPPY